MKTKLNATGNSQNKLLFMMTVITILLMSLLVINSNSIATARADSDNESCQ